MVVVVMRGVSGGGSEEGVSGGGSEERSYSWW